MKRALLFLSCFVLSISLFSSPEEIPGLIENFEIGQNVFHAPTYASASSGHDGVSSSEIIDYRSNYRLDPAAAWYSEEEPGTHSVRLDWTWIEDTEEDYRIRLTAWQIPNIRNELDENYEFRILDPSGMGFYYYYTGEPLMVAVSVADAQDPVLELSKYTELLPEAGWQYIYFDFTEPGMFEEGFWVDIGLGTGSLESEEPFFDGFFFTPEDGTGAELSEDLEVQIYIDDIHYGAPHTPADTPTSAGSWSLFY